MNNRREKSRLFFVLGYIRELYFFTYSHFHSFIHYYNLMQQCGTNCIFHCISISITVCLSDTFQS